MEELPHAAAPWTTRKERRRGATDRRGVMAGRILRKVSWLCTMAPPQATFAKSALKSELVGLLKETLAALTRTQRETQEAATHEEAKPENDKDTRALEQSYLARGQAIRAVDLRAAISLAEMTPTGAWVAGAKVALGALVTVAEDERETTYWLAAAGGGSRLRGGVQVVTPEAPLGRALIGKVAGDDCDVVMGGKSRSLEVIDVA